MAISSDGFSPLDSSCCATLGFAFGETMYEADIDEYCRRHLSLGENSGAFQRAMGTRRAGDSADETKNNRK